MMGYGVFDRVGISMEVIREPYVEQGYIKLFGRRRVGGMPIRPYMLRAYEVATST